MLISADADTRCFCLFFIFDVIVIKFLVFQKNDCSPQEWKWQENGLRLNRSEILKIPNSSRLLIWSLTGRWGALKSLCLMQLKAEFDDSPNIRIVLSRLASAWVWPPENRGLVVLRPPAGSFPTHKVAKAFSCTLMWGQPGRKPSEKLEMTKSERYEQFRRCQLIHNLYFWG